MRAYLVVGDEDDLPDVVVHRGHGVGAQIEDEVDLALHLLPVRDAPDQLLHHLHENDETHSAALCSVFLLDCRDKTT